MGRRSASRKLTDPDPIRRVIGFLGQHIVAAAIWFAFVRWMEGRPLLRASERAPRCICIGGLGGQLIYWGPDGCPSQMHVGESVGDYCSYCDLSFTWYVGESNEAACPSCPRVGPLTERPHVLLDPNRGGILLPWFAGDLIPGTLVTQTPGQRVLIAWRPEYEKARGGSSVLIDEQDMVAKMDRGITTRGGRRVEFRKLPAVALLRPVGDHATCCPCCQRVVEQGSSYCHACNQGLKWPLRN